MYSGVEGNVGTLVGGGLHKNTLTCDVDVEDYVAEDSRCGKRVL